MRTLMITALLLAALAPPHQVAPQIVVGDADTNCARLERLDRQWRGRKLTSNQQSIKAQMVAWYELNCRGSPRKK